MKKCFLEGVLLTITAWVALAASSAPSPVVPAQVQATPGPAGAITVVATPASVVNTPNSVNTLVVNTPKNVNTVPPPGGTLIPGAVGGQITSGATGGQLSPGAVGGTMVPASIMNGSVPTLPALGMHSVSNAYGAFNYGLPASTVIVAGGNGLTATGGTLSSTGVGVTRSSVIVAGGGTLTGVTGGTYLNNAVAHPSSVIVLGGQTPTASQTQSGAIIVN
jgi:hypothetical protein